MTMRLVVDRHAFSAVAHQAAKQMLTHIRIPVLGTVLLRAGDGQIELVATNLDVLFKAAIEAAVEVEGAVAANFGLLAAFASRAAGEDIELAVDGALLEARSGRAWARIPTLPADDFPELFAGRQP